jgi:hypothetical protein
VVLVAFHEHNEEEGMSEIPVGMQETQSRDLHLEVEARAAKNMRNGQPLDVGALARA